VSARSSGPVYVFLLPTLADEDLIGSMERLLVVKAPVGFRRPRGGLTPIRRAALKCLRHRPISPVVPRDFHMKSRMKNLIESLYRSLLEGTPEPIPYREILLTAQIMDAIFSQLNEEHQRLQAPLRMSLHLL
jgi:hypothetical protein